MKLLLRRFSTGRVNPFYKPFPRTALPTPVSVNHKTPMSNSDLVQKHGGEQKWGADKVREMNRKHGLMPWGIGKVQGTYVTHGEGVYLYGENGKKILDFNSQAMCANLGHTIPPQILEAINKQLLEFPMVYCNDFASEIRAKVCSLLADIMPGDIDGFFFTSGGAEANESAVRMARLFTGKQKIMTRYRSYHGGSATTLQMTGDARKHFINPGAPGIVHFHDPYPYTFQWGKTEEECTRNNLEYLRETIEYEGPHTIAAIYMESITGTNGVLIPPKGYLEGVRALCDQYGIMMICDEVMAGFGRTGKWFGFMHSDPMVIPDMVTSAKGINAAILPLGMVAVRSKIKDYFMENNIGCGSTYNSHPTTLASAHAVLLYMLEHNLVDRVAHMGTLVQKHMDKLAEDHPCVKQCRSAGLFGIIELQKNSEGEPFARYADGMAPEMNLLKENLLEQGLFTFFRPTGMIHVNPAFTITEEELAEGYRMIDKALTEVIDPRFEG